jgi:hypothetical protein
MAANIQLQSAAVDPLLRGLVDTSVVKVPFVKPPIGAVCAPFTHTRASFGLNTALPANCSLPFNSYLSVPQYCLISNSFLKVTVTVPANTQPMQYAPIFMFDSIDLLNADGRSFWQARPESTFVYINQCMEADLKLAAKNLVLAAETDCADAATAGTFTACVEFYKQEDQSPKVVMGGTLDFGTDWPAKFARPEDRLVVWTARQGEVRTTVKARPSFAVHMLYMSAGFRTWLATTVWPDALGFVPKDGSWEGDFALQLADVTVVIARCIAVAGCARWLALFGALYTAAHRYPGPVEHIPGPALGVQGHLV